MMASLWPASLSGFPQSVLQQLRPRTQRLQRPAEEASASARGSWIPTPSRGSSRLTTPCKPLSILGGDLLWLVLQCCSWILCWASGRCQRLSLTTDDFKIA